MAEERALKLHHLRPAKGEKTAKQRYGRGEAGKGGKTAGRGTKGTQARYQVPHGFEGGQTPLHASAEAPRFQEPEQGDLRGRQPGQAADSVPGRRRHHRCRSG